MDLRTRLARFDRVRTAHEAHTADAAHSIDIDRSGATDPLSRLGERPVTALLARGARWVGRAPCGYLRLEASLAVDRWPGPPGRVVNARAFALAGGQAGSPGTPATLESGPWAVLDTETTGLAGGVGTLVFLVAVVLWDEGGGRVIQYFLPEPEGEHALLTALAEDLRPARALVSYNGRAFDLPHLRARMRVHRLDEQWLALPHLDLLHPVRRLGRDWLPDARLATAERALLGRPRADDDIPGSAVPLIYQAYLADGEDRGLAGVLEHNRRDAESLLQLAQVVAAALSGEARLSELPPQAQLAVARLLLVRREHDEAARLLAEVAGCGLAEIQAHALLLLARCHRRAGRKDDALAAVHQLYAQQPDSRVALVEMAKLLEHARRDFAAAHALVREALRRAELERACTPPCPVVGAPPHAARSTGPLSVDALAHRLRRLERRLARARTAASAAPAPMAQSGESLPWSR